jgi:hypothetical protein
MAKTPGGDGCPESCLTSIRDTITNVKIDVAALKSTSKIVSRTTGELHKAILGKDGISTKIGIIWDRQERHSKMLSFIGIFAITVFAMTILKMINEYSTH